MKNLCGMCMIVGAILIIGGLNWGLIAAFNYDLVAAVLGPMSIASRVVYGVVGLSAIAMLVSYKKTCSACQTKMKKMVGAS